MYKKPKKITWIGVQPTPYNYFLYEKLVTSEKLIFDFFYSKKESNNLKFDYTSYCFESDLFLSDSGVKRKLIFRCLKPSEYIVFVGWESAFKLLLLVLRRLLNLKYAFWTDSIDATKVSDQKSLIFFVKRWLLSGADKVMTTGNFGVEQMKLAQLVKDESKIVSLPFFVEGIPQPPLKQYKDGKDSLKLLILARLIPEKGIAEFLRELSFVLELKPFNIDVRIGGVGPEDYRLKNMIGELNLQNHVTLMGWLNQNEKRELMLDSHLLVHPVKSHDPFPLVVLESLSHGLPVAGTLHAGSVCDRVQNGVNGFILEESLRNLGDVLLEVRNAGRLADLSHNAYKSAKEWPATRGLSIVEDSLLGA